MKKPLLFGVVFFVFTLFLLPLLAFFNSSTPVNSRFSTQSSNID